jgi:hypothetical protein
VEASVIVVRCSSRKCSVNITGGVASVW